MIEISVKEDFGRASALLASMQRKHFPEAAAKALNDTARAAQAAVTQEMGSIFDRPTPFTMRAVIAPTALAAKADRLAAMVTLRPIQAQYLLLEETGGVRTPAMNTRKTAAALVEPGAVALDAFGNIPSGTVRRLAAQAKAETSARARRRAALAAVAKGRKRQVAAALPSTDGVVYLAKGSRGAHGREGGFFRRVGKRLVRLTGFVDQAHYKPRFGFRDRVTHAATAAFRKSIGERMTEVLKVSGWSR